MIDAVVLGYGQSGRPLVEELLAAGQSVRVVTRSGRGPEAAERHRADLLDASAVRVATEGIPVIYQTIHAPTYAASSWRATLPRFNANILDAARASGAIVVAADNLYAYRADTMPLTTTTPLDPQSNKGAVVRGNFNARSESGARVRTVAAGDFYGPSTDTSHLGDRMFEPLLSRKTIRPLGNIDQPHAFTYLPDLARAMIRAAALDGDGHEVLFAPNAGDISQRRLITMTAEAAGLPEPRIKPISIAAAKALGVLVPSIREIAEMGYQFDRPFTVDTSADEARLGMRATPWEEAVQATVEARLSGRSARQVLR